MTYNSKKLVLGVGVKGGDVASVNGKPTQAYRTWCNMLERCYSPRCQKLHPTYIDCSVCKEWLQFPTFKAWFDENYIEGWAMDKDLLVGGNKKYGPDTCIFIPQSINNLFIDHGRGRGEYLIGVCFHKIAGKFIAYVTIDGKQKHLGYFDDANEANKVYLIAKKANVLRMAEKWKNEIQPKLYDALLRKAEEL